jgi:hypothetical protein
LALLLHHAEHNAVRAFAQARLDERQDELVPEVAHLGLHRADAGRWSLCVSGASDAARLGAAVDEAHRLRALLAGAGAGKSAGRVLDARARDELPPALQPAPLVLEQQGEAALCKPDAVQSAGRSCEAPGFAAQSAPPDEAYSEPQEPGALMQ